MLRAETVGSTRLGQAGVGDVLLDRGERLLDVRAVRELGDDQGDRVGRGRLDGLQARHAGDGALDRARRPGRRRPAEPAPGYGAMTVMTGNSMSGRSSCLRLPQAETPAMNRAPASSSVTLRLLTASSDEAAHERLPCVVVGDRSTWTGRSADASASSGGVEDRGSARSTTARSSPSRRSSSSRMRRALSSRKRSRVGLGLRRGRDDDLAAIGGILVAVEQPVLDEAVDEAGRGRRA